MLVNKIVTTETSGRAVLHRVKNTMFSRDGEYYSVGNFIRFLYSYDLNVALDDVMDNFF